MSLRCGRSAPRRSGSCAISQASGRRCSVLRRSPGRSPTGRPARGACSTAGSCRGCRARRGSARRCRSRAAPSPASAGLPERRSVERDSEPGAAAWSATTTPAPSRLDHRHRALRAGPTAAPASPSTSANRSRLCIRTSAGSSGRSRRGPAPAAPRRWPCRGTPAPASCAPLRAVKRVVGDPLDHVVLLQPVGDEVADGADLEAVGARRTPSDRRAGPWSRPRA